MYTDLFRLRQLNRTSNMGRDKADNTFSAAFFEPRYKTLYPLLFSIPNRKSSASRWPVNIRPLNRVTALAHFVVPVMYVHTKAAGGKPSLKNLRVYMAHIIFNFNSLSSVGFARNRFTISYSGVPKSPNEPRAVT